MDQNLCSLKSKFPGRSSQIEQLYDLFGFTDEPFPDSVYIYGGPSTGKSTVVRSVLQTCVRFAVVNLIECYTPKILFESILNDLFGYKLDPRDPHPYRKCDNFMEFIANLQLLSETVVDLNKSVIVLEKAEELRNMDSNILAALLRLRELSGIRIAVIFLSEIVFEKYYSRANIAEPIKIYFPQYNKDELLEILSLDVDCARALLMNNFDEAFDFGMDFYKNYLNVFLSVFYRACRDLSELRHMSRINFVKYCEPIINKENTINDSMALWRNIAPILKSSLEVLYLRVDSITKNNDHQKSLASKGKLSQSFELPYYAKYLLIAAYLASYNSAKEDKRLFMKHHGKRTKTKQDVKLKSKVSVQLNTQLGPKPFTFERLLAIFYSILDDKVGFNNNLLVQISSLVELQLLTITSDNCLLDGQKYKCNINFDFIQSISRMVGLNIRKYLTDFSHI